ETFFDEQSFDDTAAGAGLNGDQVHAQHVAGDFSGFVGGVGQLYAAGFAAAAGMDLRLHNDDITLKSGGSLAGFFLGESDFAARRGDSVTRQDRFRLILVNLHRASIMLEFCGIAKHKSVKDRWKRGKNAAGDGRNVAANEGKMRDLWPKTGTR